MYEYMLDDAIKEVFPDIVISGIRFVKNNDYALMDLSFATQKASHKINDKVNHIYDIIPSVCNKIFKRKLIGNYRFLERCKWEDIAFTYAMYISANELIELNNPDYFYRRDISKGISSINISKTQV